MRHRVFLSSTFIDLKPYRRAVIDAVRQAGFDIDPMEDWPADPRRPSVFSQDRVRGCRVCVLLAARRRGFIPPGSTLSITQQEYECAVAHGVDPLVFLLDPAADWPAASDDRGRDPEVAKWHDALRLAHGAPTFAADPSGLALAVTAALARWRHERGPRPPLPTPLSRFFGRDAELRALEELLVRDAERLVTVVAAGGYGKTRLVLELAHRLKDHWPSPPAFVNLAEAANPPEIATAVAAACGLALERTADPVAAVGHFLADATGLLILDNFEQVARYAAETVGRWGETARRVYFLVTSRTALHLDGERRFELSALPKPPLAGADLLDRARENPTVQLFVDRARRQRPAFDLAADTAGPVVELCHRLECQPLLIEIAASRLKTHSLPRIVAELKSDHWLDAFETSERAFGKKEGAAALRTLLWSHSLLTPAAQAVFAQVCVFRSGFDDAAARAVVRLPPDCKMALPLVLEELVDHCFLRFDPARDRFDLYARSIHEYGWHLWPPAGPTHAVPADLGERWADHYEARAEACNARLDSPDLRPALDELEADRENLMEAQDWAYRTGQAGRAARLTLAALRLLDMHGPQVVARERLEKTLALVGPHDPPLRSRLLGELSGACWSVGDFGAARPAAAEAQALAEAGDDLALKAEASYRMGLLVADQTEGIRWSRLAIRQFEELGRPRQAALARVKLANLLDHQGEYAQAIANCHAAVTTFDDLGAIFDRAVALNMEGLAHWHYARPGEAVRCFGEAEQTFRGLGNYFREAGAVTNRGLALIDLGRYDEAIASFDAAVDLLQRTGNRAWLAVNRGGRGLALARAGRLEEGLEELRGAEERASAAQSFEDAAMHAGSRGRVLASIGRHDEAAAVLDRSVEWATRVKATGTYRHLINLAHHASVCLRLGRTADAAASAAAAEAVAARHGLGTESPLPVVGDGLRLLGRVRAELGPPN